MQTSRKNAMKCFSRMRNVAFYSVVGTSATCVEWLIFFILNQVFGMSYVPALMVATVFSAFTNWAVGRLILFRSTGNPVMEMGKIYLNSIISLLWNLLLMWIMVDRLGMHPMVAKVIATLIGFIWNYTICTKIIYKGKTKFQPDEEKKS